MDVDDPTKDLPAQTEVRPPEEGVKEVVPLDLASRITSSTIVDSLPESLDDEGEAMDTTKDRVSSIARLELGPLNALLPTAPSVRAVIRPTVPILSIISPKLIPACATSSITPQSCSVLRAQIIRLGLRLTHSMLPCSQALRRGDHVAVLSRVKADKLAASGCAPCMFPSN